MPFTGINSVLFNTTAVVKRRVNTVDSIGDYTVASLTTIVASTPATFQPFKKGATMEDRQIPQGKEYRQKSKVYIPLNNTTDLIKDGDLITDNETSLIYEIVGIDKFIPSNVTITSGHHIRLELERFRLPNS